jgi:hypothetical protein
MDAAKEFAPVDTELLLWAEICARYPDQFVCLLDVVPVERWSPAIASGRVAGHGPTRRDASAIVRSDLRITRWTVVYTGVSKKPLRRPPVFFE